MCSFFSVISAHSFKYHKHDLKLISKKDNIIFANTISQQYQRIVNRIFHTWLNLKEAQCRQDKRFISIIWASP